jgi:glycosyltransferase involved in cell wall biosynthesis
VTVVLPCLNEAASVGLCVEEALAAMGGAGYAGEVIVVDNGSDDGSPAVAEAAGARVVHEPRPGYGSALLAGIAAATTDLVVMADADHTYPLDRLAELVAPVARGDAELALGSRLDAATKASMPFLHRFVGTPVLSFLAARASGRRLVRDSQSGFRAFRRDTMVRVGLRSTGMEFASEMLIRGARNGLRITEVELGYRERIGDSKLSTFADGWRHLHLILLLAPDLLLIYPGVAACALGAALTILTLVQPAGVELGSLDWQPVFFSSILLVLGLQAMLAGAVLANRSSVADPSRRLDFVGSVRFANACVTAGIVTLASGLLVDLALFIVWVRNPDPPDELAVAALAQSLIMMGGTLASFGIVLRVQRARTARKLDTVAGPVAPLGAARR